MRSWRLEGLSLHKLQFPSSALKYIHKLYFLVQAASYSLGGDITQVCRQLVCVAPELSQKCHSTCLCSCRWLISAVPRSAGSDSMGHLSCKPVEKAPGKPDHSFDAGREPKTPCSDFPSHGVSLRSEEALGAEQVDFQRCQPQHLHSHLQGPQRGPSPSLPWLSHWWWKAVPQELLNACFSSLPRREQMLQNSHSISYKRYCWPMRWHFLETVKDPQLLLYIKHILL